MPNSKQVVEEIKADQDSQGLRLDVYLARMFQDKFSRSHIKKMIEAGSVKVDGRETSAHHCVKFGEVIHVRMDLPEEVDTQAENIPLDILYEDNDLIVLNKPAGLVVHPAHGNWEHTLVNALLYHTQKLSKGQTVRPGIVHRLDKDTSGVMVIAKNDKTHASLGKQFKNHTIERMYYAVVRGVVQHDEGLCEEPVGRAFLNRKKVVIRPSGGKDALTHFKVEKRFKNATLLRVFPKTGRTHQIRVHLAHMDHPVLGDTLYGITNQWITRQSLHASVLGFQHPTLHKNMSFSAEMPQDMKYLLSNLESQG